MLVYLWSKENPTARVSFFGLFAVQGLYLPYVLVGWTVLQGGSPVEELRGIVAGHLYYFLTDVYPRSGGPRLIQTPELVRQFIQSVYGCVGGRDECAVHIVLRLSAHTFPTQGVWVCQRQLPASRGAGGRLPGARAATGRMSACASVPL